MQCKAVISQSLGMANMMFGKYLEDLDDAAFMIRPIAGMNHIAWQMGHLIAFEQSTVDAIKPGSCPELPEGFAAKHSKEAAASDDPKAFYTKDEYLSIWNAQRAATKAVVESVSDADLDEPAPEGVRSFCPTVGDTLNMLGGIHPLMHVGQFVAVRRMLNKPIAM